jgi:hypothetical protein
MKLHNFNCSITPWYYHEIEKLFHNIEIGLDSKVSHDGVVDLFKLQNYIKNIISKVERRADSDSNDNYEEGWNDAFDTIKKTINNIR